VIRGAIFDLDGTLIDSRRDLADAVNVALAEVGLPERSLSEITTFIGEGSRRLVEKALGRRQDLFEAAHAAWEAAYRKHLLRTTGFYPGMRELLETVGERFQGRLAVHTNKPGVFAREILEGLGGARLFVRVLGGGDGPKRKPAPDGAQLLLTELALAPADAVYVGDSTVDLDTAEAAGLAFAGCAWGYGGPDPLRSRGARVANDVQELRALLFGLAG
jgi:phosphoglycolate phosphatase